MLNRFPSWPIRRLMIVLLFCVAIPCLLLVIYSGIEARNEAITMYQKATLRIVSTIASEQQAVGAGVEQLVTALALLPQVKSRDRRATDVILSQLLKKSPHYTNIAVADKSGLIWASAVPFGGNVSVADRKYFQEAVRSGMFSSGEYTEGRITKKAVINFSYPVKNTAEGLESVIVVALDLDYTQGIFEKISLPEGASFSILDHQGIILIRNRKDPMSAKLIGKRDLREELFSGMKKEADEGTFESIGNDGQKRLLAYKRISLPHESQPYLYVRSSIPLASITSKASATMFKNLSVIVLLSGAGLLLVWVMGRRMIMDPIMQLKKASKELAIGSTPVKVSQAVKGGELGDLAQAFDQMAGTLIQRETALRDSEAKANDLIRYAPTGICEIDYRGPKFISVNDAMCQILGYTREELISMGPAAILDDNSRAVLADRVRRQLAGEKIEESVEYRVRKKDGSFIDTILNISLNLGGGDSKRALVIVHDITERKWAEEALRISEQRIRLLGDNLPGGAIYQHLLMPDGRVRYAYMSAGIEKILGMPANQVMADPDSFRDLILEEDRSNCTAAEEKSLREGSPYECEFRQRTIDGKIKWVHCQSTPRRQNDGSVLWDGVVVDITERKRAEETLRLSEERFAKAFAINPAAIAVTRLKDGLILEANETWLATFGYSRDEVIGHSTLSLQIWPTPEARARYAEEVREKGSFRGWEQTLLKRSGEPIVLLGSAERLTMAGEEVFLSTWLDITERKRAEEELRKAHDELELRVQERTEELAKSQERLRHLASQLLLAQEKERKRVAVDLHDGLLSELAAMKMLFEAKMKLLEQGKLSDLSEFKKVSEILALVMREARGIMNNLHPSALDELGLIAAINWLTGEYERSYPHIRVQKRFEISEQDMGESLRIVIFRVLQEALNNFAKHGKGDRVELSLAKLGSAFAFTIRDNGQGFDVEKAQKGLGLESMRERVELSGGKFQIESVIGQGTTIRATWSI